MGGWWKTYWEIFWKRPTFLQHVGEAHKQCRNSHCPFTGSSSKDKNWDSYGYVYFFLLVLILLPQIGHMYEGFFLQSVLGFLNSVNFSILALWYIVQTEALVVVQLSENYCTGGFDLKKIPPIINLPGFKSNKNTLDLIWTFLTRGHLV